MIQNRDCILVNSEILDQFVLHLACVDENVVNQPVLPLQRKPIEDGVAEAFLDAGTLNQPPRFLHVFGADFEVPDDDRRGFVLKRACLFAGIDESRADADPAGPGDVRATDPATALPIDLEREELARLGVMEEENIGRRALIPCATHPAVGLTDHAAFDLRQHLELDGSQ